MKEKKLMNARKKEPKLDEKEGLARIAEARTKVAKLRLELAAGKMKNVRTVRKARKELARLLTKKREEEFAK